MRNWHVIRYSRWPMYGNDIIFYCLRSRKAIIMKKKQQLCYIRCHTINITKTVHNIALKIMFKLNNLFWKCIEKCVHVSETICYQFVFTLALAPLYMHHSLAPTRIACMCIYTATIVHMCDSDIIIMNTSGMHVLFGVNLSWRMWLWYKICTLTCTR